MLGAAHYTGGMHAMPHKLRTAALAEYYGVSRRTVERWRLAGMPSVQIGTVVIYDLGEVDAWLRAHSRTAPTASAITAARRGPGRPRRTAK